jgi:hypothetical protein
MEPNSLPTGITHQHHEGVDVIAWSYQKTSIAKENIYILPIALLLFGAATLFITYQVLTGAISDKIIFDKVGIIIFMIIMWAITVGILVSFFSLTTSCEAIHISDDKIILRYSGIIAPKSKQFNKNNLMGLAFKDGRYYDPDPDEPLPALSLFYARRYKGGIEEREAKFALWMQPEDKHQLFLFLQHIFKERGWHITYRLNDRPFW